MSNVEERILAAMERALGARAKAKGIEKGIELRAWVLRKEPPLWFLTVPGNSPAIRISLVGVWDSVAKCSLGVDSFGSKPGGSPGCFVPDRQRVEQAISDGTAEAL